MYVNSYCSYLPIQQSALELQLLPVDEKSLLQLLLPHTRFPEQCESVSQSPPPEEQGEEVEQQLQPVEGTPLHAPGAAVGPGVVVGFAADNIKL